MLGIRDLMAIPVRLDRLELQVPKAKRALQVKLELMAQMVQMAPPALKVVKVLKGQQEQQEQQESKE
jgi:hypothetical protein